MAFARALEPLWNLSNESLLILLIMKSPEIDGRCAHARWCPLTATIEYCVL